MYRIWYQLRLLLTLLLVVGAAVGVYYFISIRSYEEDVARFYLQVTAAVGTAVQQTLYDVTRTAEAPLNVFRVVTLGPNEDLEALAQRAGTTLEILQVVNGLGPEVRTGSGETIILPLGLTRLEPPRTITAYTARAGDTLESLAERNIVPLALLQQDNPALAQRGLVPGDTVFIGFEL
jgi:LysM repeat protein